MFVPEGNFKFVVLWKQIGPLCTGECEKLACIAEILMTLGVLSWPARFFVYKRCSFDVTGSENTLLVTQPNTFTKCTGVCFNLPLCYIWNHRVPGALMVEFTSLWKSCVNLKRKCASHVTILAWRQGENICQVPRALCEEFIVWVCRQLSTAVGHRCCEDGRWSHTQERKAYTCAGRPIQ